MPNDQQSNRDEERFSTSCRFRRLHIGASIVVFAVFLGHSGGDRGCVAAVTTTGGWELDRSEPRVSLVERRQLPLPDRGGRVATEITIRAPGGVMARIERPHEPVPIIDELEVTATIRCIRSGAGVGVEAVLPRSLDPQTGMPYRVLLRGTRGGGGERWFASTVSDLPHKLQRAVRVLRAGTKDKIDPREAYVDRIVCLIPGGRSASTLTIDEISVRGVPFEVSSRAIQVDEPSPIGAPAIRLTAGDDDARPAVGAVKPVIQAPYLAPKARERSSKSNRDVKPIASSQIVGGRMVVNGTDILPRLTFYYGEPLAKLARLGFNLVVLKELPTPALEEEALEHEIWLLAPPPSVASLEADAQPLATKYRAVAGWYVAGDNGPPASLPRQRWIEKVRYWDLEIGRPVLYESRGEVNVPAHLLDCFVARVPHDPSTNLTDYLHRWGDQQRALHSATIPLWYLLSNNSTQDLNGAASSTAVRRSRWSGEQWDERDMQRALRLLVASLGGGVIYDHGRQLTSSDAWTRRVAIGLELEFFQQELMSPWLRSRCVVGQATSRGGEVAGPILRLGLSQVAIPCCGPRVGQGANQRNGLRVPFSSSYDQVYQVDGVGIRPVPSRRFSGGVEIDWGSGQDNVLLISRDQRLISAMRQKGMNRAKQTIQLTRSLALARQQLLAPVVDKVAHLDDSYETSQLQSLLESSRAKITQVDTFLATKDTLRAAEFAGESLRDTDLLVARLIEPLQQRSQRLRYPMRLTIETAPEAIVAERIADSLPVDANRLFGGDFETLHRLTEYGWVHLRQEIPGVRTWCELSSNEPYHGDYCLRMAARPHATSARSSLATGPVVRVASPKIAVDQPCLLDITGWVRIDRPIQQSVDGLEIREVLREEMAPLRIRSTSGWEEFRILRRVDSPQELQVTFTLTGLGEVLLDGVMVRTRRINTFPAERRVRDENHPHDIARRRPAAFEAQSRTAELQQLPGSR